MANFFLAGCDRAPVADRDRKPLMPRRRSQRPNPYAPIWMCPVPYCSKGAERMVWQTPTTFLTPCKFHEAGFPRMRGEHSVFEMPHGLKTRDTWQLIYKEGRYRSHLYVSGATVPANEPLTTK